MIGFLIFLFCGFIILAIGIYDFYAKKQQSFWNSGKMPKVDDIKKWNCAIGNLFCFYGISLIFAGVFFLLPLKSSIIGIIVSMIIFGGIAIMILVYLKIIVPKYKVK